MYQIWIAQYMTKKMQLKENLKLRDGLNTILIKVE